MRVSHIQGVSVKRQAFRSVSGRRVFCQSNIDSLNLFVSFRVNHGHAVFVGINHKQPRALLIQHHCGRVLSDRNVSRRFVQAMRINHDNRCVVPTRNVNLRGIPLPDQIRLPEELERINAGPGDNGVGIDKVFAVAASTQINSIQSSQTTQVADDPQTVAEVIRDK